MIIPSEIKNFFSSTESKPYRGLERYEPGYQFGLFDIINAGSKREQSILENKILDYIPAEVDPNYNRGNKTNRTNLETLISKLGLSTSIVTSISTVLSMLNVYEFIPTNIQALLGNYQAFMDTGISSLSTISDDSFFRNIAGSVLRDFEVQFGNSTIAFNDIVSIYERIDQNFPFKDAVENNGIRSILSLPLQSLLGDLGVGIIDDLTFLDRIDDIFGSDTNIIQSILDDIERLFSDDDSTVEDYVDGVRYTGTYVTMTDPLGLVLRDTFKNEFSSSYVEYVNGLIQAVLLSQDNNITPQQQGLVYTAIKDYYEPVITEVIERGNTGLPSLGVSVKGVKVDMYNKTVEAVQDGIRLFVGNTLTKQLYDVKSVINDTSIDPVDYLINLKKNLKKRLEFQTNGIGTSELNSLDIELKAAFISGNVSLENINTVYNTMTVVFKDQI